MKSYFVFATGKRFPSEAIVKKFDKFGDAQKFVETHIEHLKEKFNGYVRVTRSKKDPNSFEVNPKLQKGIINLQIVRIDVHDPITLYTR